MMKRRMKRGTVRMIMGVEEVEEREEARGREGQ